ncbi:MAG: L,D-transpeptidase family protein [bacterium]|nr:L,D-transpeptidase family protein [bacterium]
MKYIFFVIILLFIGIIPVYANLDSDRDLDGVPDKDEIGKFYTNPDNPDTDGDGFNDWVELNSGFSPYTAASVKLEDNDADNDGLSDRKEISYGTNPVSADTDGDGFSDKVEILAGYNPLSAKPEALEKKIVINRGSQTLTYYLGDMLLDSTVVSTGKAAMPTPAGEYKVIEKNPYRWSRAASLWMPFWLMFDARGYGIHELPEWPGGIKEGQDHLGTPVSHGCVRLGVGPAAELYTFAELGTKVIVN